MADWNDGYVTDVGYTYGFYREMAPMAMRYALLASGHEAPPLERFTYCELGCGQGAGLNLLAASNPQGQFWGTDFNPSHAVGAARMAQEAGLSNVRFMDDSFEEFSARTDLPQFDYVALHGVYSWVGPEHCKQIVEFLRKRLAVGGAVYISYNALPGWTHAMPLRGLLNAYVDSQTAPSAPLGQRLEGALKLLNELNAVPGSYFKVTPQLAERIQGLKAQSPSYLAHEYLNRHWTPYFFGQVVEDLAAAKLSFAAHAVPIHCVDAINHTQELQAILDGIPNPTFKEVVRDLGINQTFRRDIFVRGPRRLVRQAHAAGLLDTTYALAVPRSLCSMKIRTTIGEAQLQEEIYGPVLDRLTEGPQTGRQLAALPAVQGGGGLQRLMQVLIVLVGSNYIQPCMSERLSDAARDGTNRFNRLVLGRAARGEDADLPFLATPLLGSGLSVPRLNQLFLAAINEMPDGQPEQHARAIWNTMRATRQSLLREGKVIDGDVDGVQELVTRLNDWKTTQYPIVRSLAC